MTLKTQSKKISRLFGTLTLTVFLVLPSFGEPGPSFVIHNEGTRFPVYYEEFGEYTGVGTNEYKYKVRDRQGLAEAMGEGLFPNNGSTLFTDPAFVTWNKTRPRNLNPWDFVQTGNPQVDFYVWALSTSIGPGTRMFYVGKALAEAGHYKQALKAYHCVLVQFPREACWSADKSFVWYLAGEALNQIEGIVKTHPEIGYRLKGAAFKVTNGNDTDLKNDVFVIDPGTWEKSTIRKPVDLTKLKIKQKRGYGKVQLVQFENKHWQMWVDGKPFVIRGVTYHPTAVGRDIADTQGHQWMYEDRNKNGRPDTPYDSWIDKNKNEKLDKDEPPIGDFKLLQDMGANAIRMYRASQALEYNPKEFNKKVLRDLQSKYGIYVIMGDFLGAYTIGSGASWDEGTDYTNSTHLTNMKRTLKAYVLDHKDEPYVLMWVLGNENLMRSDYSGVNATRTKAAEQVEAYLKFVNEMAKMIHQLDPNHPVTVGNLNLVNLDEHAMYTPDVDIFGANAYPAATGFGTLWDQVQHTFDRPVLITEFGCDAFHSHDNKEDEEQQAKYHEGTWNDIQINLGGGTEVGNSIGGVIFEFLDEWWKSSQGGWDTHDDTQDSPMAFPDGWSSEEWFGLFSQGDGSNSPLLRQPRKVYFLYKDKLWKRK